MLLADLLWLCLQNLIIIISCKIKYKMWAFLSLLFISFQFNFSADIFAILFTFLKMLVGDFKAYWIENFIDINNDNYHN